MTVTSGPAKVVSSPTTVTVTLSAYDSQCIPKIYYRVNDGDTRIPYSGPFTISAAGDTLLRCESVDLTGNWETIQYVTVRIDTSIPHVTTDALARYRASATINLTVVGDPAEVAVFQTKLDSEPTQTVSGVSATVATTQSGSHRLGYYIRNKKGVVGTGAYLFSVEEVPRTVKLAANVKELTYPGIVELVATASNPSTTTARFQRRRRVTLVEWGAWETIDTVTSTTNQFVSLDVPRYGYEYKAIVGSIESSAVAVSLRVPMGKPLVSPARVKVGKTAKLSGTIRPRHGAATTEILYRLYWERYDARLRRWVRVTGFTNVTIDPKNDVNNDMSKWVYNLSVLPSYVGAWRVRSFHQCPRHKASYSTWTTFTVYK